MHFGQHFLESHISIDRKAVAGADPVARRQLDRGRCHAARGDALNPAAIGFFERRIIHFAHPRIDARDDTRRARFFGERLERGYAEHRKAAREREPLREACRGFQALEKALPGYVPVLVTDVADFAFYSRLGWLVEYLPSLSAPALAYRERKARYLAWRYRDAPVLPASVGLALEAGGEETRRWLLDEEWKRQGAPDGPS
jgi:hypothetical protein